MTFSDHQREMIIRYLDQSLDDSDCEQVEAWLHDQKEARDFLREVAEQAILLADLEKMTATAQPSLSERASPVHGSILRQVWSGSGNTALGVTIGFIAVLLTTWWLVAWNDARRVSDFRVEKVTGSSRYLASTGQTDEALLADSILKIGDSVETRSCDAWVTIRSSDLMQLTIAGHSNLRLTKGDSKQRWIQLTSGAFWVDPPAGRDQNALFIETSTAVIKSMAAQLNIHTTDSETVLRVNRGIAEVTRRIDGRVADVPAGCQLTIVLGAKTSMQVIDQPTPVNSWTCRSMDGSEILVGQLLPPSNRDRLRVGAAPLLWPIPQREPVMLYAAAVAAWKSSRHPVQLQEDSVLWFRGRFQRPKSIRFGFSTQKIQGVFSGKFEIDVDPSRLKQVDDAWEVLLPLAEFFPVQPELGKTPQGLELTDVYALTINEDVGLEINEIELIEKGASSMQLWNMPTNE